MPLYVSNFESNAVGCTTLFGEAGADAAGGEASDGLALSQSRIICWWLIPERGRDGDPEAHAEEKV